jgi:hypothetical protein
MRHPEAAAQANESRVHERLGIVDAAPTYVWLVKLRVEFPGEGPRWLSRTCASYEDAKAIRAKELRSGKFDMSWIERAWNKAKPRRTNKTRKSKPIFNDGGER